jgi:hypothetical protein
MKKVFDQTVRDLYVISMPSVLFNSEVSSLAPHIDLLSVFLYAGKEG